jgi:sortase A
MALYQYIKEEPTAVVIQSQKPKNKKRRKFFLSGFFLLGGLMIILWVLYPIAAFEITSKFKYQNDAVFDTLGANTSLTGTDLDYAEASNWMPKAQELRNEDAGRIYFLTIPKLKIFDAQVKIAGEDLNKSLIHYGGTGLPGDYGTSVIFGHSILPQFYDPKNYKTIFTLLPKLDKGDEIFIKYDGITYRYMVGEMRVTTPDDLSVLEQRYDSSYVSLVTCVPPGTYWKRLLVRARLTPS